MVWAMAGILVAGVIGVVKMISLVTAWRRLGRVRRGECTTCRYPAMGTESACSECGATPRDAWTLRRRERRLGLDCFGCCVVIVGLSMYVHEHWEVWSRRMVIERVPVEGLMGEAPKGSLADRATEMMWRRVMQLPRSEMGTVGRRLAQRVFEERMDRVLLVREDVAGSFAPGWLFLRHVPSLTSGRVTVTDEQGNTVCEDEFHSFIGGDGPLTTYVKPWTNPIFRVQVGPSDELIHLSIRVQFSELQELPACEYTYPVTRRIRRVDDVAKVMTAVQDPAIGQSFVANGSARLVPHKGVAQLVLTMPSGVASGNVAVGLKLALTADRALLWTGSVWNDDHVTYGLDIGTEQDVRAATLGASSVMLTITGDAGAAYSDVRRSKYWAGTVSLPVDLGGLKK